MKFRATIKSGGKKATGIEIPAHVVDGLGAGRKPLVKMTINGHTVDVDVQVDTEPRTISATFCVRWALD
ncbi:MAG: DUF1905 domain-containing protein [Gemmatimonas sp.]